MALKLIVFTRSEAVMRNALVVALVAALAVLAAAEPSSRPRPIEGSEAK